MNEALASTWAYWSSGGILLLPLALVCFGITACFLRLRGHLARLLRESRPLVEDLAALTPGCGLDSARSVVEQRGGGFALLLRHALDGAGRGDDPSLLLPRREEQVRLLLRRDLLALAALTGVAPLLGLLGTVAGMIFTFDAVAATGGETASRVAGGISTALITTQFGLVIALPGVFGLARLERLLRAVEVRMAECRAHLAAALGEVAS